MSTFAFIFGRDSALSLAELAARYPEIQFLEDGDLGAIAKLPIEFDQNEMNQLGGLVKAGEVLKKTDGQKLSDDIVEILLSDYKDGKLNYAVSIYGWQEKNLRPLLAGIKKNLKEQGINSRFANQNFNNLSVAQHKGLKGDEILVCKVNDIYFISKVIGTQDIDKYSKRDYYKPFRDMKMGMMPPKLAQMMINFTGSKGRIWDPFCGGGVLVMEGLLMGHDMIGSDISEKHLNGAVLNVDWLQREFSFKSKVELFIHDATQPLKGKRFDAIACEGYLGPPQERPLTRERLESVRAELNQLYIEFFSALKSIVFKGPVVIAMPFFRGADRKEHYLDYALNVIEKSGFKMMTDPLFYAREDQIVGRAIYRFQFSR